MVERRRQLSEEKQKSLETVRAETVKALEQAHEVNDDINMSHLGMKNTAKSDLLGQSFWLSGQSVFCCA